ncbi:hypothetical protein GCM10010517_11410 [Streptosporangium fragile]|uniref:Uncharacterized protein n=1 Tax=Streptosporangium fragile TaxID=46186 RepID=A0ABP6I7R4_9ACTN
MVPHQRRDVVPARSPAALATAQRLRAALARHGISAIVKGDDGLAMVSVCAGLTVWCNGERFWWYARWDAQRRCRVNASQEVSALDRAAERIAAHHARFWQSPPGSAHPGGAST